jgi:hypothetical protein
MIGIPRHLDQPGRPECVDESARPLDDLPLMAFDVALHKRYGSLKIVEKTVQKT